MPEIARSQSWTEDFSTLSHETAIRYTEDLFATHPMDTKHTTTQLFNFDTSSSSEHIEPENLKDQLTGFAKAWGELLLDMSKGCKDILKQSLASEDSYLVKKFSPYVINVSKKLRFLNEFLPEDRDPLLAWPVVFFVFIIALAALNVNTSHDSPAPLIKKMQLHPTNASLIELPDGRRMAYHERGMSPDRARFTIIAPHPFLSSRLGGIPGVNWSLLQDFGVRLITYDLPGFGESDPHPTRNLNSSAFDMMYLADSVGVRDKFWVLGYSSGSMHAWAALNYIPSRVAGAAMVAPMVNPYDSSMNKEEMNMIWEKWERRRRMMFTFARRFPRFLSSSYRRSFLSGVHGEIHKWLSLSLGDKDKVLIQDQTFEEHWHRDVEESVRQGSTKPFIEEAVLQVNPWGFSLADLQMRRTCLGKGILPWLKSIYKQEECELTGFPGPVHIWQGMADLVVPPSMTGFVSRVLPSAILHKLPNEGHFSYYYLCDKCHREIFSTLLGEPQGPIDNKANTADDHAYSTDAHSEETSPTDISVD